MCGLCSNESQTCELSRGISLNLPIETSVSPVRLEKLLGNYMATETVEYKCGSSEGCIGEEHRVYHSFGKVFPKMMVFQIKRFGTSGKNSRLEFTKRDDDVLIPLKLKVCIILV